MLPPTPVPGPVPALAPAADPGALPPVSRDAPDPPDSRKALASEWAGRVSEGREFWRRRAFDRMLRDMKFAGGEQWSEEQGTVLPDGTLLDAAETRYVANVTLRHINQRTARIYAKNPRVVAKRKPRLTSMVWDGSQRTLMMASTALQSGIMDPNAMAIVQDAMASMAEDRRLSKLARTLELLFEHELDEQVVPFKVSMKSVIRRALTTGTGWVKLGYERVMALAPEAEAQVASLTKNLATLERLAQERAEGDFTDDDAKMEQLSLLIQQLSQDQSAQVTVREGLLLSFPDSTAIIPDPNTKSLRGFVGSDWVAEEYFLTADQIQDIYRVDVQAAGEGGAVQARRYDRSIVDDYRARDGRDGRGGPTDKSDTYFCVWEIYSKVDGMVYVVCDGHPDFLAPPAPPVVRLERFWPWLPFLVNEVCAPGRVFPPSDVELMRHMQAELNRSRQGLREHRRAARPRTYTRKGLLSEDDKARVSSAEAHTVIELEAIQPGEKITDVLQDHAGPQIDPALYDTSPAYEDYLRTMGQSDSQLGGTSGATATEASFAEAARGTDQGSVVDDLDEFLSELSRAAGQVLLSECSGDKVTMVVGPGAVWPELSRDDIMREIYLDVEAASTGRPNKAQEVQNAQIVFPLLMQIPNIDPEWMARELLRRLDDKVDLTDAFSSGMPSIQMLNAAKQPVAPGAAGEGGDPRAQGDEGANNQPSTDPGQTASGPRPTQPGVQPQVQPAVADPGGAIPGQAGLPM